MLNQIICPIDYFTLHSSMRKQGKPVLIGNDTSIIVQPEDLVQSEINELVVEQNLQEAIMIEESINAEEEVSIESQDHPFKVGI